VAVAGNTLRIVSIDNLGAMYNQTAIPLRYTPRKMCRMGAKDLVIVETDHNEFDQAKRAEVERQYAAALSGSPEAAMDVGGAAEGAEDEEEGTVMPIRGPVPATDGQWASCIRVLDAGTGNTKCLLELAANEAAFSVCTCKFPQHSEETFIVVGTAQDLTLHPKRWSACFLHVYRVLGDTLQLLHRTEVEDIPMCLAEFQGRLLVGTGRCLRMYDLGKRKLLKKCENKTFPAAVARIQSSGDRIFVGDLMESVFFVKYRRQENALVIFADEAATRFVTSMCVVDHSTVAGVDKFGNVFTVRVSDDANEDVEVGNSTTLMWEQGAMSGAPNKLENLTHFYLGKSRAQLFKESSSIFHR
jgi:splicing factor 3B subunit 3